MPLSKEAQHKVTVFELNAALLVAKARGAPMAAWSETQIEALVLDLVAMGVRVVPSESCVVPRVTVTWTLARLTEALQGATVYPESQEQLAALAAAL